MATIMRIRTVLSYGSGGPGLNTIYWDAASEPPAVADASDAVARVRTFFDAIKAFYANSMTFSVSNDVATFEDTTGDLTGRLAAAPAAVVVGTGGAAQGPLASMYLVQLRTNLLRNNRLVGGRWYLGPPASVGIFTTGQITGAAQTAHVNAATAMLTGGATASVPIVWHRPNALGPGASGVIVQATVWSQFGTMRSRRDS